MAYNLTTKNYNKAISFDELVKAAELCGKGTKWKESVAKYLYNKETNICLLRNLLLNNTSIIGLYLLQSYIKFFVYDPKKREITATRIRDRVLQRSLCNNGLYDAFVNPFIYDNLACLKGKGTTKTIERTKFHLALYFKENNTHTGFYLKLDIKHYFESTPHSELKKIVSKYIIEPHFLAHMFQIIDSFKDKRPIQVIKADKFGERGIGLGSLCSLLLLLLYLNDLDHYIKEQLKVKHYLRYMDDMLLFVNDKQTAINLFTKINTFVLNKGLLLNTKSKIGRIEDNVEFCKIRYHLTKSGKVKTKVVRKSFTKEIRRLNKYKKLYLAGKLTAKELILHGNTWYGFAKWRCSGKQIKYIKDLVKKIFNNLL